MKRILQLFLLAWCCLPILAQNNSNWKMAVISDVHIMAPALLQQEGSAFQKYVAHDRKMLKESPELLKSCIGDLIKAHPQVVLITGDLTKDGEKLSHEYLSRELLLPLKEAGIAVYVIPGNHDINNPHAVVFLGDSVKRTDTVTPEEFARYYQDYGYGQAIARDPYSLSYVVQLNEHTRLLGIDACKYEENDFERNTCVTGGRIKPETMEFIRAQVEDAEKHGCHLLTMMHHGLIRHWKWQDKVMKPYLVDHWKKRSKEFARLGLDVVFTGHFHAQDISSRKKRGRTVYDIETGSTVSYPLPYRLITFNGRQLHIETHYIRNISSVASAQDLKDRALRFAKSGMGTIVRGMLPAKVPDTLAQKAGVILGEAYAAHLGGDERMPATYRAELKGVCKQLRHYTWKYAFALGKVGKYLYTDLPPQDNNVTIETPYAY